MGRMKDYFEFSQLLHWLSNEALQIMLETEADAFRASIIKNEMEARLANPASRETSPRTASNHQGNSDET